uniref:ribonuclease H n=1 Tax=Latimeria chalumnae TaxID=7897 RepID=H3AHV8_LATCH
LGDLSPVKYSDWATPIVLVVKKDGTVWICGNFKTTPNPIFCIGHYSLSWIEDLLSSPARGQYFSRLDLSNYYFQMSVDDSSRKYQTISTQKGLYQYNSLPLRITSAPVLLQWAMNQLLKGVS